MEYKYTKPEKISLDNFIKDFIPNYDEIGANSGLNFQSIEVWEITYCIPPNSPYNPATCTPIG